VRDGKTQGLIVKYLPEEQKSFALIEAGSARAIRPKNEPAPAPIGSVVCSECRHLHCQACEENSAAKQYSDFWICHRCGELNRRV
jgi:hypothetical protein